MSLTVPIPIFSAFDPANPGGPAFSAESAIRLSCGPVTFPNGSVVNSDNAIQFSFAWYRNGAAPSPEMWNGKSWIPQATPPTVQALFPQGESWQSIFSGIGTKDTSGQPQFGSELATGSPSYFAKCFFAATDGQDVEHVGVSPASTPINIFKRGAQQLAGISMEPESMDSAQKINLFLRDAPGGNQGTIGITLVSAGFVIELAANGASVTMDQSGKITLHPASGQPVFIDGALSVATGITVGGTPLLVP